MCFDEEFLRQALYQCLFPAYLTNTGGSARADVLALARVAAALRPSSACAPRADLPKVSYESQVRIRLGWFWSVCIGLAMRAFG